jgi:hypothetical protein
MNTAVNVEHKITDLFGFFSSFWEIQSLISIHVTLIHDTVEKNLMKTMFATQHISASMLALR